MSTFSLVMLIIGIVEPALAASGVIPSNYQPLAQAVLNAIGAFKAEATSTNGTLSTNTAILLQGIVQGIKVLSASGALPAAEAGLVQVLDDAAGAGIAAYQAAGQKVDPTQLNPISPAA